MRKEYLERRKRKSGQIMLEYLIALAVFLSLTGLSAILLYVFKVYGGRVLALMASA